MNIEKIKKELLKIRPSRGSCAGCGHKGTCLYTGCRIINEAVGTLDELQEELRSEMHRHDRLQDFEVAEAQELAKYKAERRWIPVTERLPEEHNSIVPGLGTVSKPVLVTWMDPTSEKEYPDNSFVREGITRNGEFTLSHINGELVAVAWMPQPKPYELSKEGKRWQLKNG